MAVWQRTVACGEVSEAQVGQEVTLNGWVNRNRDQGGIAFLDLRDRTGIVQVADGRQRRARRPGRGRAGPRRILPQRPGHRPPPPGRHGEPEPARPATFEVAAREIEILNPAKTPPFPIAEDKDVDEMLRLKYRYLDLRRPAMYEKMRLRHEAIRLIREFMYGRGFLEIETPIMTKSSPGRRARLPGALPPRSPACSTPCRRPRSSSSSS